MGNAQDLRELIMDYKNGAEHIKKTKFEPLDFGLVFKMVHKFEKKSDNQQHKEFSIKKINQEIQGLNVLIQGMAEEYEKANALHLKKGKELCDLLFLNKNDEINVFNYVCNVCNYYNVVRNNVAKTQYPDILEFIKKHDTDNFYNVVKQLLMRLKGQLDNLGVNDYAPLASHIHVTQFSKFYDNLKNSLSSKFSQSIKKPSGRVHSLDFDEKGLTTLINAIDARRTEYENQGFKITSTPSQKEQTAGKELREKLKEQFGEKLLNEYLITDNTIYTPRWEETKQNLLKLVKYNTTVNNGLDLIKWHANDFFEHVRGTYRTRFLELSNNVTKIYAPVIAEALQLNKALKNIKNKMSSPKPEPTPTQAEKKLAEILVDKLAKTELKGTQEQKAEEILSQQVASLDLAPSKVNTLIKEGNTKKLKNFWETQIEAPQKTNSTITKKLKSYFKIGK